MFRWLVHEFKIIQYKSIYIFDFHPKNQLGKIWHRPHKRMGCDQDLKYLYCKSACILILLSFVDILVSPEFLLCNSRTSYINVKSTHFGLFYFILFKQSGKKIYRVLWPWNWNDILQFDEIASYCKRYFFSCLKMKSRTRSFMTFIVSFDMAWKENVIQGDRRHGISWIWNFLD